MGGIQLLNFSLFFCFSFICKGWGQSCGQTYTSATKTLTSPNFPDSYSNFLSCTYTISVPEAFGIHIHFNGFSTESCCDFLRYGSGSTSGSNQLGSFSGPTRPSDFQVETGTMWFHFTTDGSASYSGFSLTYSFILETDPPIVSGCPDDIETTTELGTPGTNVTWTEPNATNASAITTARSHAPGSTFLVGETHVAYIYTDAYGMTAACTFLVIMETVDTTIPTIVNCIADIYQTTEFGTNGTTVLWNEPNATDLSGNPRQIRTHAPSSRFLLGDTEVNYSFVDTSNNTANCSFMVTVYTVDTTPPDVFECPLDIASVGGRHVSWREPSAFDLSQNISTWRSHSPGLFVTEHTEVHYTFTDASGNTGYCNFTVNVVYDVTPPEFTSCPNATFASSELGSFSTFVYWSQPSVRDDNGRVMLLHASHLPGERFYTGTTPVQYSYVDDSYNMAICNFSVIVIEVDSTPPTIHSCPSDITLDISPGKPNMQVFWDPPSASDLSHNVSLVSQSHNPGNRFTHGRTDVVYAFIDGSYNEALCSFHVNVQEVDPISPSIVSCPNNITAHVDSGSLGTIVRWVEPTVEDASGFTELLLQTHAPGTFFAFGTTKVSYIYKDNANDMEKCSFWVRVVGVDKTFPGIFNCPSNIITTVKPDKVEAIISWEKPFAVNLSPSTKIYSTHSSNESFPIGSTYVVYTFEDTDGFKEYCNFTVVVTPHVKSEVGATNSPPGSTSDNNAISLSAFALSLLIIVLVIIFLLAYFRKKNRNDNISFEGL